MVKLCSYGSEESNIGIYQETEISLRPCFFVDVQTQRKPLQPEPSSLFEAFYRRTVNDIEASFYNHIVFEEEPLLTPRDQGRETEESNFVEVTEIGKTSHRRTQRTPAHLKPLQFPGRIVEPLTLIRRGRDFIGFQTEGSNQRKSEELNISLGEAEKFLRVLKAFGPEISRVNISAENPLRVEDIASSISKHYIAGSTEERSRNKISNRNIGCRPGNQKRSPSQVSIPLLCPVCP